MKYTRILLILLLALALINIVPVIAQDASTGVEYVLKGTEFQKIENGVIVQVWSLTDTTEMLQIAAIMQAQAQFNDPTIDYTFDRDRMYILRGDQVIALWELRGESWVDQPALVVRYDYDGHTVERYVNDRLQETWTPIIGSYQWVSSMQAEANKLVAEHVNEELNLETKIEHLPMLLAPNFTVHYTAVGQTPDMTWYYPEIGNALASVLPAKTDDPVVLAMENLVVIHEPTMDTSLFDILHIPEITNAPTVDRYDLYRLQDGKVTDIWLGYDLATLTQPVN